MANAAVNTSETGRDLSHLVEDVGGRKITKLNDAYPLPGDDVEMGRLTKQHQAIMIGIGGLTPCQDLVDAILAPEPGEEKTILDLGCGSGVWAFEMAKAYPEAKVLGVDIASNSLNPALLPPNLRYEIHDINKGLRKYYNKFDVVQVRCVLFAIHDFKKALKNIQLCVKPGGLVIHIEADIDYRVEDRIHSMKIADPTKEGPDTDGSWIKKVSWESERSVMLVNGHNVRTIDLLDLGLWDDPLADPETAVGASVWLPIGPWAKVEDSKASEQLERAGELIRSNFLQMHRAYHPIFLKRGLDQAVIDGWSAKVDEELLNMTHKMWVRCACCWARRRAGPGLPAPALPLPLPSKEDKENRVPYPYFTLYKTKEEAAAAARERFEDCPPSPESDLLKACRK